MDGAAHREIVLSPYLEMLLPLETEAPASSIYRFSI